MLDGQWQFTVKTGRIELRGVTGFSFICFKSKCCLLYCFWGKDQSLGYLDDTFSIYQKLQGKTGIEPSANLTRSYSLEDNTENKPFT